VIHDHTASVLALARNILGGVDSRQVETRVQTESLKLILNTLIMLGTPKSAGRTAEVQAKTVAQSLTALNRARDEAKKVIDAEQAAQEAMFEATRLQRNA
jgi:hypothetical protein